MLEKPNPDAIEPSMPDLQRAKGRRMLALLMIMFALPVVLVVVMYKLEWRPAGGTSNGVLQQPPRHLRLSAMQDSEGRFFPPENWKNKWSMLMISPAGCPSDCLEGVHVMRQVHVALNKEIARVQRVLLMPGGATEQELRILRESYPDMHVLIGPVAADLTMQFGLPGDSEAPFGNLYLVDPVGNWMMSYPMGFDPKGLLSDLQRLLKYSWIG